jgi:hypothetical protein
MLTTDNRKSGDDMATVSQVPKELRAEGLLEEANRSISVTSSVAVRETRREWLGTRRKEATSLSIPPLHKPRTVPAWKCSRICR